LHELRLAELEASIFVIEVGLMQVVREVQLGDGGSESGSAVVGGGDGHCAGSDKVGDGRSLELLKSEQQSVYVALAGTEDNPAVKEAGPIPALVDFERAEMAGLQTVAIVNLRRTHQ
jgi:hypothetical protein